MVIGVKVLLSIFVCKLITKICKIFGKNGTVFPGGIVYDYIDKDILTKLKYPKYVIAVTGSAGKGSTTELIAHILRQSGLSVIYNESGSNGILGAMTLILNNCNWRGKFKYDVLLLECDERHTKEIFAGKQLTHMVILNITRDQPCRHGNANVVFKDIKSAINKSTTLILDADDPKVNVLKFEFKNSITYGLAKTKDSYVKPMLNAIDYQYCPFCHKKLSYNYYHYNHVGNYECRYCNFKRGKVDYEGKNLDLIKEELTINNDMVSIHDNALYAAYSTLAAYALCATIGIDKKIISEAIANHKVQPKSKDVYKIGKRTFYVLSSKNENASSYYHSLKLISNDENIKNVVIGFEKVSRRYPFNDLSWLYDIEFEMLNDEKIDKIYLFGKFKYNIATRLEYAKVDMNKIIMLDDINEMINNILNTSDGDVFLLDNFSLLKNTVESYLEMRKDD